MDYNIIGSSSKGNCIVVEDVLMLDIGLSYSKIKKYLNKVKLVFVSHVHKDHLLPSSVKTLSYNYPTIKFLTGSNIVVEKLVECGVNKKNIYVLKSGKKYDLGLLKVKLEPLEHDTPNYALKWELNEKKGIYAVDTSEISHIQAKNYDLFLIENNYQDDIINFHIQQAQEENDKNKLYYLQRTLKTHLSKSDCDSFLIENMGSNSVFKYVHLSKYNNTENGDLK